MVYAYSCKGQIIALSHEDMVYKQLAPEAKARQQFLRTHEFKNHMGEKSVDINVMIYPQVDGITPTVR